MKKAPHNLPAAGALGEQLTFIDPPPFCPAWPMHPIAPELASEKTRGVNAGRIEGQGAADSPDPAGSAFATARALAALAGFGLHRLDNDYLLTRWGWCRELPTLREVGALLRRIGGRP